MGGVSRFIRRAFRASPHRDPLLSVIVPVHNVEPYLAECLSSLLAQTFSDFEAILVDDGSTDGSAAIARRYVDWDPRVRLIQQENGGLGAARNAGVEAARGEFLVFLDSDDTVPPRAYATMMRTIERTGSDMVVGSIRRGGPHRAPLRLMSENHRTRRESVTLDDMPLILADVFAVNKVFRRSFWDQADLRFMTNTRYEDQPTVTRAFVEAKRFDVIPETVYSWRMRKDLTSITQQRSDIADLVDRVATKRTSTELVAMLGPHVREVWFAEVLPVDMWEYFRAAATCSDQYWKVLRAAMAEFWNAGTIPFHKTRVPAPQRLLGWLVAEDRRRDVADVVEFLDAHAGNPPLEIRGDRVWCLLPGVDDRFGAPTEVFLLGPKELRWQAAATAGEWRGTTVRLEGFARIRNVVAGHHDTSLQAWLDGAHGRRVSVGVQQVVHRRVTGPAEGRSHHHHHDWEFELEIDLARLAAPDAAAEQRVTYHLVLERTVGEIRHRGGLGGVKRLAPLRAWHPISSSVEARLAEPGGELVVELRNRTEGAGSATDRPPRASHEASGRSQP